MISQDDMKKIAILSRLALTDQELTEASHNLAAILDHFASIQQIDTTNVPQTDAASGLTNISRADEAEPEILATHDRLLELAPQTRGRHLKVAAVFAEE